MTDDIYFSDESGETRPYCADCNVQMEPEGHCKYCWHHECPECGFIWYP